MGVAALHTAMLDEMDERVRAGARNIRIFATIVDGVEEGVGISAGRRTGSQEMEHRIQTGCFGLVCKIKRDVKKRMRTAAFDGSMFHEMDKGILARLRYVRILRDIKGRVKELKKKYLFLGVGRCG